MVAGFMATQSCFVVIHMFVGLPQLLLVTFGFLLVSKPRWVAMVTGRAKEGRLRCAWCVPDTGTRSFSRQVFLTIPLKTLGPCVWPRVESSVSS